LIYHQSIAGKGHCSKQSTQKQTHLPTRKQNSCQSHSGNVGIE
jgi:hypothetical protein